MRVRMRDLSKALSSKKPRLTNFVGDPEVGGGAGVV
jgi:hypothetical protein